MDAPAGAQVAQCVVCGAPLDRHDLAAGRSVCELPECRRRSLAARAAERAATLRAAAARIRDREHPGAADRVAVGVVPSDQGAVQAQPAARQSAFRKHLARVVARADRHWRRGERELDEPWSSGGQPPLEPPAGLVEGTCGTCRGHCCRLGGTSAFLDEPAILRYRRAHVEQPTRDVYDAYLAHLPERAVEGSCVYHGDHGCHLPRAMRAAVCNAYHCEGLFALVNQVARTGVREALIAATDGGEVVRHRSIGFGGGAAR